MKNKKGISPLIATVLLIGFTVALAAVVMTWGGGFVKKTTEQTGTTAEQALACTNLNFKITGADCSSVSVQNPSSYKITALKINKLSADRLIINSEDTPSTFSLVAYASKLYTFTQATGAKIIQVIPTLEGGIFCGDSAVEKAVSC